MRYRYPLVVVATFVALAGAACSGPPGRGETDSADSSVDVLVLGGTVVTMDAQRTVIVDGGVAVDEGRIVAVERAAVIRNEFAADTVIEVAAHDIVIPGLVNGHNHAAMTLLRGVADDLALMDWLQRYIFPAEAELVDEQFVRAGTRLAALEMIRTGTTTFTDMYYFEDVVAEVIDESGLRGIPGETIIGFPSPDSATPELALEYTAAFLDRWRDHPRVTPAVAPHAPYTLDPEVLTACADLARSRGVPLMIHLAEASDEVVQVRERYGTTPTAHLDALGFLGPDTVAFHGIWLDDDAIVTLADRGVGLVHNPESNMKLAAGTMRVTDLQAAEVPVGLGTDGAASNNDLDMFDAMLVATLLHKHMLGDPTAMPARDVFAMATIEGARALHMDGEIGSLEPGKRADLVIVRGDVVNLVPRYDPYSHLVYAATGADVRGTLVEGEILYLYGEFRTLDREAVVADARDIAERVRGVVGGDD